MTEVRFHYKCSSFNKKVKCQSIGESFFQKKYNCRISCRCGNIMYYKGEVRID